MGRESEKGWKKFREERRISSSSSLRRPSWMVIGVWSGLPHVVVDGCCFGRQKHIRVILLNHTRKDDDIHAIIRRPLALLRTALPFRIQEPGKPMRDPDLKFVDKAMVALITPGY